MQQCLKIAPRLWDHQLSPILKGFKGCSRSISPPDQEEPSSRSPGLQESWAPHRWSTRMDQQPRADLHPQNTDPNDQDELVGTGEGV